jgi:hypothetical protein
MRAPGAQGGRHDDRERGADAELHAQLLRDLEMAKHLIERRYDDGAAADAEEAGKDAGGGAGDEDRQRQPDQAGEVRDSATRCRRG